MHNKYKMMQNELDIEHGDISGEISVTLANKQTLDDFCAAHILDYNRERFEAFAIRLFLGKETVITVYAIDKIRQKDTDLIKEKIAVKKFKLNTVEVGALFSYCASLNFTLTNNKFSLENMEVMNK